MVAALKFRHRIVLLVVVAGIALAAVTATTLVMTRRSERQLSAIRTSGTDGERAAVEAALESQRTALAIEALFASGTILLLALWAAHIVRSTVQPLRQVAIAMEQLGRGELPYAIEVAAHDELGALAQAANRAAAQLSVTRAAFEDKATELERASHYKTQFLANMSHELRTPLNSIMILSKVLGENEPGTLTARQVELTQLIYRSGHELLALINEVLDLSKIEAGKQEILCEQVEVSELAIYTREMFQPLAMQKRLELMVEVAGDVPDRIRTDQRRLAQILKNLLANAFKFTERGGVTVRISRGAPGPLGDTVAIAVSDTGIGISADKLAWIFEAFAQANSGTSRKYGGTGLGLTIARQLAVRLGGDLSVASTPGRGSVFQVVLPIAGPANEDGTTSGQMAAVPASAPMPARDPPEFRPPTMPPINAVPDPVLAGKLVLIVDDDMRSVYSLSSTLRAEHLTVLTASDGEEAIVELNLHPHVDVVVMDVMMSHGRGYEITRRIREQARFARLPIIALTAQQSPDERAGCLQAGASDCVAKSIEPGRLVELIRRSLDGSAITQRGIQRGMVT